jgi:hypothetical protein
MNTTNHTSPSGEELKRCPFCGDEAEHIHVFAYEEIVRCRNACCFVRPSVTCELPEECMELWNRRAAVSGEDAANGAIGEREAFDVKRAEADFKRAFKGKSYAPFEILSMFEAWQECMTFYGFATPDHSALYIAEKLTGSTKDASFVQAHINQAVSEAMDRAALTAEKVAAEPVAIVRDNPDDIGTIIEATRPLEVGTQLYLAAPQQPAQSAEQDERAQFRAQVCCEVGLSTERSDEEILNALVAQRVQLRRQARAAEPVTLEQVKALEVAVCHGQSGEALRLLHHMRNALAAPQPAQTQLALTDTDLEKLYWTAMNNAADILRYMDEARAILAAQPVSGQTEGNQ